MAGAYCKFCGRRCFVLRVIPDGPEKGWTGHLATCQGGMAHDLKVTGYTHITAINLMTPADAPSGQRRPRQAAESGARGAAGRHRALALRALARGHGVQWAADITGLPLRLVARVAAEYRIPGAPVPDMPCGPSLWEALVLAPRRLYPRRSW